MATYTTPSAFVFSGAQAGFVPTQGWIYGLRDLRDALVGCGLVQTTDTGQIDFTANVGSTTAPAALAAHSFSGFFIMRFNDALQATKPVFVKLRFQSVASGVISGLQIQVGEGTNGAGDLTGRRTSAVSLPMTGNAAGVSSSNSVTTLAAGGGTEAFVAWHHRFMTDTATTESFLLGMERTRDATGAVDGEGVLFLWGSGANTANHGPGWATLAWPTNGSTPADSVDAVGWLRGVSSARRKQAQTSFVNGNDVGPLPPVGGALFPAYRHTTGLFLVRHSDIPNDTIFTASVPGGTRTFRQLGQAVSYYVSNRPIPATWDDEATTNRLSLAMLWE